MNNKIKKVDTFQTNPVQTRSTYGPATSGIEFDINRGGGIVHYPSATYAPSKTTTAKADLRTAVEWTKAQTGFADTIATDMFTVTVPNAKIAAAFEVDVHGSLGAGGAIGAGEASRLSKYQVIVTRTPGVNAVAAVSAAIGGAASNVAGAANVTSVIVTAGSITGGVGAVNTFTIKVAITKSGGASDNHTAVATVRLQPQAESATPVTVA